MPNLCTATDNSRRDFSRATNRAEVGLPKHGFVFCYFNNNYKITLKEFEIWMRLLLKIQGSIFGLRKN